MCPPRRGERRWTWTPLVLELASEMVEIGGVLHDATTHWLASTTQEKHVSMLNSSQLYSQPEIYIKTCPFFLEQEGLKADGAADAGA